MNDGDQAIDFIYLLLMLVLIGSAFSVRRLPIGQALKMAAAWILIFGAVFIGFTLKDDFAALGRRVLPGGGDPAVPVQQGEAMRIRQSADGHFWVQAQLNGQPVRFLVDSGATTTSISVATARRAGIAPRRGLPAMVQTANGIVEVQRGRAERFELGTIRREDLAVHISESFGETNVLGMNLLSSLSGWGVERGWLILKP
ncbi:MAG TPA: TIGR02281 family clan AA aspartic protease [Allosphingosinicella sp.]|jgi:aspartyl protease family protein|uniref:retropepsin-like aspartic protease family protein n=1 Tax=Allosphingosinicella sp. TaxID=2823234 RepID=UPI002F276F7D